MKLRTRLLVAQLPALLVILGLVVWGGRALDRLGAESQRILAQNYRSVLAAERMKEAVERIDSSALFLLAGSPERATGVAAQRDRFEAEMRVQASNITEPGEAELVGRLSAAWARYVAAYAALEATPPEARHARYFAEVLPAFEEVKRGAQAVLEVNQAAMERKSAEAEVSAAAARRAWLAVAVVGLVGAAALGAMFAHRVTVPLRLLARTADRVGEGQLDVHLPRSGIAELDALAATFDGMAARLLAYRREGEGELARARESAQAAIESFVDPVVVLTVDGAVRATNGAARRLFGAAPAVGGGGDGVGAVFGRLLHEVVGTRSPVVPADFTAVVLVDTPEGERALLPHATPIRDAEGRVVGVTLLLQDVTRLRRLDELKGDLVQTVAHELRTPLTSLGMALHLALDERVSGPVQGKLLEFLATARDDVRRLRALVEDLLDLSRIQEGRMVLRREPVSPVVLLTDAAEAARAPAEARDVGLDVDAAPQLAPLQIDRTRLHVALGNVVANAVRHSPPGGRVTLRARSTETGVRLEVDDQGPGVPAPERERIFGAFARGEGSDTGGAGLGLYIAREVVRAHGGRMGVVDAPAAGARFWIELPSA